MGNDDCVTLRVRYMELPAMIVKVQLPIASSADNPPMLVYNEDRSVFMQMPIQERFVDELKDFPRGYYNARFVDDQLVINERIADQAW